MFFHKAPGIGLDIGSKKIKIVKVKINKKGIKVLKFGSIPTPSGAVEAGIINNPEVLGEALGELVRSLKLKGKGVVSAVSGQQVYTRNLVMPRMSVKELKEAVTFQAMTFLPIPVEESAIDIFPLREFEDEEGKKTEVFFAAVRQQQVDSLETVCQIAGLKLKVVEIEPLALYRLIGNKDDSKVKAFLNIGSSRSYFAVFNNGILVFYRSISIGFSAFYQDSFSDKKDANLAEFISEVSRSMEYYQMQKKPNFEKIILCGGGSQIKGIDITLAEGIGRRFTFIKSLSRLILPKHLSESAGRELHQDFSVALGMAAREVI